MKLHRDSKIGQSAAWVLLHRLREVFSEQTEILSGTVEVDETFVGGLEKNKHSDKQLNADRGGTGKSIVVGAKERDSKKVKAKVIKNTQPKFRTFAAQSTILKIFVRRYF